MPDKCFKRFIFSACVSLTGKSEDQLAQCHPGVFAVNVMTRAQAGKAAKNVDLFDTLIASVLLEERLSPGHELVKWSPFEGGTTMPVTAPVVSLPLTREALITI